MDPYQLRPLGVGEVVDAAIKIYRGKFGVMVKAVAVVVIPVQILNVLVLLSVPTETTTLGTDSSTGVTTTSTAGLAALLVTMVIGLVSGALAQAACLKTVSDTYLGAESDWKSSLRFGFSHLGSLLWLTLIHLVVLVLGFVACIVPGVWLYAAWSVAVPVLLVEGTRGFKALGRSSQLVKGRWWPTAGALLLANLLTSVVSFAASLILVPLVLARDTAGDTTIGVTQGVLNAVAGVLTTPFIAAAVAVIYFDLRVRKEGFDLQLMAQRVGTAVPGEGFAGAPGMPWAQPEWGYPAWGTPDLQQWGSPSRQPGPPPGWGQSQPGPAPGWAPPPGWGQSQPGPAPPSGSSAPRSAPAPAPSAPQRPAGE